MSKLEPSKQHGKINMYSHVNASIGAICVLLPLYTIAMDLKKSINSKGLILKKNKQKHWITCLGITVIKFFFFYSSFILTGSKVMEHLIS